MAQVDKTDIKKGLAQLGVGPGAVLLVHSSLKSFGRVIGGPATVIAALLELLGPEGTLAMPVFSNSTNPDGPPFDVKTSPSRVGLITETFRRRPGVLRANQPTHSIAAFGKHAATITQNLPSLEPYDRRGSFGRLYELAARVLFMGCTMAANSTLHAIEDWAELPYLGPEPAYMLGENGQQKQVLLQKMPVGDRDFYRKGEASAGTKVVRFLRARNAIQDVKIGASHVQEIAMRTLVDLCMGRLKVEPDLLLCDRADCDFCTASKEQLKGWKPGY